MTKALIIVGGFIVLFLSLFALVDKVGAWKEPELRLTSMCVVGEQYGVMRFREEEGVKDCVNWKARTAGGSVFAEGCVNGGEAVFFDAPYGKTIIVDWSYGEHKGSTTKAQNTKQCEFVDVCVNGDTVSHNKDLPLPEGATEGECVQPTPTPTATPFQHVACNTACNTDLECEGRDPSYRCTPQGVCRLKEAPEREECNPRPTSSETPKPEGVMTPEELMALPAGRK